MKQSHDEKKFEDISTFVDHDPFKEHLVDQLKIQSKIGNLVSFFTDTLKNHKEFQGITMKD